ELILTNPPGMLADQFVRHALTLAPRVIMLLRLAFLESDRRSDVLEGGQLARIHVFRKRLPMMHRHGWQGPRASSSIPFAWFVWHRDHHGKAEVDPIIQVLVNDDVVGRVALAALLSEAAAELLSGIPLEQLNDTITVPRRWN